MNMVTIASQNQVRRDLKLLEAAKLSQILNALFPVIGGKRAAEKAVLPSR